MKEVAYVNGVFCDLAEARVSIEDRGFQFADGVYEVVVAPGGRPFRLAHHLERLRRSTEGIGLEIDYARLDLPGIIARGIELAGFPDTMIYVQLTRGAMSRDHLYPQGLVPTVVATFKAKPPQDPERRRVGLSLETVRDFRWEKCYIKATALLANVMVKNAARSRGCFDGLMVSSEGWVRETSAANIFIVSGGRLKTPPAGERILHGVTRGYILECGREIGLPCDESEFTVPELMAAEEAFLSSTTLDIMPVTRVDGRLIGTGTPGPVSARLLEQFYIGMR